MKIRAFEGGDTAEVVALLAESLHADVVTPALFTTRALLDPNFEPESAPVAVADGRVVGFMLGIARRRPLEDGPDDSDRAYVTLFAVRAGWRGRGIGSALLEHALDRLRERGCRRALVSPYAPNYWTPGVDVRAYPEAVSFLAGRGFETVARPLSMEARLDAGWRAPEWVAARRHDLEAGGLRLEAFAPPLALPLVDFLRREFPGDWQRYLRETMAEIAAGARPPTDLLIAADGLRIAGFAPLCVPAGGPPVTQAADGLRIAGFAPLCVPAGGPPVTQAAEGLRIAGFAQHEGERFGPIGVAASERGRGIGAALLAATLEQMQREGRSRAWFMWTDDRSAARIYAPAGFAEIRRYALMSRDFT